MPTTTGAERTANSEATEGPRYSQSVILLHGRFAMAEVVRLHRRRANRPAVGDDSVVCGCDVCQMEGA